MRSVLSLCVLLMLTSCASMSRQPLKADVKNQLKQVALVDVPEPESYAMVPPAPTGSVALLLLGAIGGAIQGSIHQSIINEHTTKFTTAVSPFKPNVSATFLSAMQDGLAAKGYVVTRVTVIRAPGSSEVDPGKLEGPYDAWLIPKIEAGYVSESGGFVPSVTARLRLVTAGGKRLLYSDTLLYNGHPRGPWTAVAGDPRFKFGDAQQTISHAEEAAEGMRNGATRIAERVVETF